MGNGEAHDVDTYAHKLALSDSLREPVIRAAIQALQLPAGSRGLDAGCGIGSLTPLLAEAVAPGGHVTGLDISPAFLARARETAHESGLSERVSFQKGNVNALPFDGDTFDWAWSVDCVGYPTTESLSALKELVRVVKPGGSVAILGWTFQQLLPGYPQFEARLNATSLGVASYMQGKRPQAHFMRALGWFGDVGLERGTARTFIGNVQAPLDEQPRDALLSLFEMLWEWAQPDMTPEDRAEFQRLCRPESPDFILNLPDYCAFFTYSLFQGQVVK
jgi:SAM-dependent methyltransferase